MSDMIAPLPKITLQDAVKLAIAHLSNNQVPNKHRRLGAACWDMDTSTEQWHWYLSWMTADELHKHHHISGNQVTAELIVNISDDGQASHTLSN